jgi:hypothetical protein
MKTPRIRSVQIPEDEQGVFASLARLTDPALDGLDRALRHAVPTLDRQELISQLRREPLLAAVPDLDEIIGSLVSVAGTAYSGQVKVEDFAQVVVDAILGDGVIELSDSEAALLTERLKRLTTIECLEIIAKGNVILRANDRNFRSASIVSEFRPVCLGEDLKVSAGIIVHQLAIRISHNGRSETAYFALDSDDVTSLIEVASRAIRKERSLREFANRSAIPILIPPPGE